MLEALLNDRTYFVRRHMDFLPRTPEQVERLRIQNDRIRARSNDYRKIQKQLVRGLILNGAEIAPPPRRPRWSKSCRAISRIRSHAAAT